jgi:hypothetical protein
MTKIIIIVACVVVALGILTAGVAQVYKAGQDQVRAETLTKAVKLVKERDALNVKVKTATPADVCGRLGGKWMPDTNECG